MKYFLIFFSTVLSAQSWIRISDFPGTKRDDGIGVVVNDKVYFGTGLEEGWQTNRDFQALDLTEHTWSKISPMPPGGQRQYANAFPGPGCFYIFGGEGSSNMLNNMWRYDVASDSWANVASRPGAGVMAASCMVFGNKVIIAGGKITTNGPATKEVWQYSIDSDTWMQKADFPFPPRWRSCAAVINNKGYLMFGIDDSNAFRKEMYRYHPSSDTWEKVMDFAAGGRAYATLQADRKKLVLFGGYESPNKFFNDTWFYNDSLSSWTQGPSLPGVKRRGDMSCLVKGQFIISCGLGEGDIRLNETWLMDVPVGILTDEKPEFSVFPNPVKDYVFVKTEPLVDPQFELLDVFGKPVEITTSSYQTEATVLHRINLQAIAAGFYLLKIRSNKSEQVKKIIRE